VSNVYPLHDDTKVIATELAKAWRNGRIDQNFEMVDLPAGSGTTRRHYGWGLGVEDSSVAVPSMGALKELAKYDLIDIIIMHKKIDVTLLQELLNTVDRDFHFTDYRVVQNPQYLTIELQTLLADLLSENMELRTTITELETESDQESRRRKAGKIIEQLGNAMQHTTNFAGTIQAIQLLLRLFG